MKNILFLISIGAFVLFSCKKECTDNCISGTLDGKWRMKTVKDNASGFTTTKPATINGEVEITFTSATPTAGAFTGVTPTNDIWLNDYTIGTDQTLSIPALSMTKVAETSWGREFIDNITASRNYNFESDGKLSITTSTKTLTFKKL